MGNTVNKLKRLENETVERQNTNKSDIQAEESSKQGDSFRRKS